MSGWCGTKPGGVSPRVRAQSNVSRVEPRRPPWDYRGVDVELTPRATEILRRSYSAARRFNPDVHLRLARVRGEVQATLVDAPGPGDSRIDGDGFVLHVEPGLGGRLEVHEPHDRLVLVPT